MNIGRITVSDRASAEVYADRSGPEIEAVLREQFPGARFETVIVPDEMIEVNGDDGTVHILEE